MFFSHIWWQNNPKLPQNIIHVCLKLREFSIQRCIIKLNKTEPEAAPQLHLIFRYMFKKLSASFHPFCFPAQDFE